MTPKEFYRGAPKRQLRLRSGLNCRFQFSRFPGPRGNIASSHPDIAVARLASSCVARYWINRRKP